MSNYMNYSLSNMTEVDLINYRFPTTRNEFRKEIIKVFLDEIPGNGKGRLCSRYEYTVKVLKSNNRVILKRPAQFNNGFDFTLNVSGINFNAGIKDKRATQRPSHHHILTDLRLKKESDPVLYEKLIEQITKTYNCQCYSLLSTDFTFGYPSELILECLKWLFLEQDVTYWNYSGRAMLYNKISEI